MLESVLSLRFFLLLLGAVFIAGIYLWGSARAKRNARIRFEPRRARFRPRRRASKSTPTQQPAPVADADPAVVALKDVRDEISEPVVVETAPVSELPAVTREGTASVVAITENQMELALGTQTERAAVAGTPVDAGAGAETIIALYVKPNSGHEFAGRDVVKALDKLGFRFGEMDIFHHFGSGELSAASALFSVANMLEPGHFDLSSIDDFQTPGLAMFLRLPGPLDGAVVFELFLNTAQRLADLLSAQVYCEPTKLLDGIEIDKLRRQSTLFANAG